MGTRLDEGGTHHMLHAIKSGAAALAAATIVLAGAGAAHAATTRVDDAQGDVWKGTFGPHRIHWDAAGSSLNGDIDAADIDHGVEDLTLTTTFKRLAKEKVAFQPYWLIRTDAGTEYGTYAYAGPHMWRGQHEFFNTSDSSARPIHALRGDLPPAEGTCDTMTHRIDYAEDTVTVTIPRTCLGDPAWVKVKSVAVSSRNGSDALWVDNAHNDTHAFRGFSEQVDAEPAPVS